MQQELTKGKRCPSRVGGTFQSMAQKDRGPSADLYSLLSPLLAGEHQPHYTCHVLQYQNPAPLTFQRGGEQISRMSRAPCYQTRTTGASPLVKRAASRLSDSPVYRQPLGHPSQFYQFLLCYTLIPSVFFLENPNEYTLCV